MNVIVESM